jgi:hypothetical protein
MAYETNKLSFILSLPKEINEYCKALNKQCFTHTSLKYLFRRWHNKVSHLLALTYGTLLSSQGTDAHCFSAFDRFSGQTAKSSPYTRARSNRPLDELNKEDAVRPKRPFSQQGA